MEMKVLVACEYSGIVRDAFTAQGHDATSCDILPTETKGKHYQGDALDIIGQGWDLMIAHPPCQYLSNAGIGWYNEKKHGDKAKERKAFRRESLSFFMDLYNAPIEKICIENPVGFINVNIAKPTQLIQPYNYGHPESKRICLWLKNLPKLKPTKIVEPRIYGFFKTGRQKGKPLYFHDQFGRKDNRAKERSKFFGGIANAMAKQWS